METHVCSIVSPHLLDALAVSEDPKTRQSALNTLKHSHHVRAQRKQHFNARSGEAPPDIQNNNGSLDVQGIVPDHILEHIASSEQTDVSTRDLAQHTLDVKKKLQDGVNTGTDASDVTSAPKLHRQIYDMQHLVQIEGRNDMTFKKLPGKLVRSEGEVPVPDEHVNQAYDNCAKVLEFYQQIFNYTFLDDLTAPVISSIHFEDGYQNAQWIGNPTRQMVYGDGGHNIYNFTACLDVIGHEMTHAVTENICTLKYEGESGALNEHISDVFGIMVRLWDEKKTSAESDWLIGEGCLMPGIKGVALRNMKLPGTAYDDPQFGKDPQPGSWAEIEAYKAKHKYWASYDHQGVHVFSGVPNRAFVLASEALGGYCWEKAGKIWWTVLKTHRVSSTCSFVTFADATVDMARQIFDDGVAKSIRDAWDAVGVLKPTSQEPLASLAQNP